MKYDTSIWPSLHARTSLSNVVTVERRIPQKNNTTITREECVQLIKTKTLRRNIDKRKNPKIVQENGLETKIVGTFQWN